MCKTSRYRLSSSSFERHDEEIKVEPKSIIVLSVEGNCTEKDYFSHLNTHLDNTIIHIEVLGRKSKDGSSDLVNVIELLDEYVNLTVDGVIPPDLEELTQKYSRDSLKEYLDNPESLTTKEKNNIKNDLFKIGIDLDYRNYLENIKSSENDSDYFAVIIDRDCGNHTIELIESCIKDCEEKGYGFFMTNPCFEFWLLLHLIDVKNSCSQETLEKILQNEKVSNKHTFISKMLSETVGHYKKININMFNQHYYPNIDTAISRVQEFETDLPKIIDNLGSNLPDLFKKLKLITK